MSSKKKEPKSTSEKDKEPDKEKADKKKKSVKEKEQYSEEDDATTSHRQKSLPETRGSGEFVPLSRKVGNEEKERKSSRDDDEKEKRKKANRRKRFSMDKSLFSTSPSLVIRLTQKREKDSEIVSFVRQDTNEDKIDIATEAAEYEIHKLTPEMQKQYAHPFEFSEEMCQIYAKLFEISNSYEMNTQIHRPEFVLIGPVGHGKSSLLEALLGHVFAPVSWESATTKRPLFLQLSYNATSSTPKWTLKRDPLSPSTAMDIHLSTLKDVTSELQKRSTKPSSVPLVLQGEWSHFLPLTLIDTPGIPLDEYSEPSDAMDIILPLIRPLDRIILCVEEANDWNKLQMIKIIQQIDPEFSRTVFVYTKFHSLVTALTSSTQTNKFFKGVIPNAKVFFTEIPSHKLRQQLTSDQFREKLIQGMNRDLSLLEKLEYDRSYQNRVGVPNLCRHLMKRVWRHYHHSLSEVAHTLKKRIDETENSLISIRKQLEELEVPQLRAMANAYIMEFVRLISRLLTGTAEGFFSVSGQTLVEEKTSLPNSEWLDLLHRPIKTTTTDVTENWNIPLADTKLYGGQQFERLLFEFRVVCERLDISHITVDDIAIAMGMTKFNDSSNNNILISTLTSAAATIATHCSREAMRPLIEQLGVRTIHIMKRLAQIAEKIIQIEFEKRRSDSIVLSSDIEYYPYLVTYVREAYYQIVEELTKECQQKCGDEFFDAKTIVWEMSEFQSKTETRNVFERSNTSSDKMIKEQENVKHLALKLTNELFKNIVNRITRNVILKFYNFVYVPLQSSELLNRLQRRFCSLKDDFISELFQPSQLKEKLKREENKLNNRQKRLSELEQRLTNLRTAFTSIQI